MEDQSRCKIPSKIATESTIRQNVVLPSYPVTSSELPPEKHFSEQSSASSQRFSNLVFNSLSTGSLPFDFCLQRTTHSQSDRSLQRLGTEQECKFFGRKDRGLGFGLSNSIIFLPDVVEMAEYWRGPNYRTDVDAYQYALSHLPPAAFNRLRL